MNKSYFLFFLFSSLLINGQIAVQGTEDGSITITPNGVEGKSNSTIGQQSVAVGSNALKNNTADNNTAIGDSSMFSNTTGFVNTAFGVLTLKNNTTAPANTAVGAYALTTNTTGSHNTGIGNLALYYNTTGIRNTAIGNSALFKNDTNSYSTAIGNWALINANAEGNTAVGVFALKEVTSGVYNTAIGVNVGRKTTTGGYNTFLGFGADASSEIISNATAIGENAIVDATNKVRIGNANISVIEGQVAWSNPSDRRLKEGILYTSRLGLDFINGLKTVSYNYIADKNKVRYDGFIAQDIEKLITALGVPFSGLKSLTTGCFR